MQVQPYLFFDGRAEEAIELYRKVLDAKVEMLMRFKESPDPQPGTMPPGSENKVMHAALKIGDTLVMVSDGQCAGKPTFQGFALAASVDSAAEADRVYAALADGGQAQMPLTRTFFSPRFGILTDRFGVQWMVMATQ
jgi:PhnB protein